MVTSMRQRYAKNKRRQTCEALKHVYSLSALKRVESNFRGEI